MRPAARRPRVHCPLRSAAVAVSVFPPEKMKTNTIGARRQKLTSDINTGAKHNSKEQLKNWKNGRGGKRKKLEMKSGGRKGLAGGAQEFTARCISNTNTDTNVNTSTNTNTNTNTNANTSTNTNTT